MSNRGSNEGSGTNGEIQYSNIWSYREGYVCLGRQRNSLLLTLWAHELIDPLHLTICRSQIETLRMKWQQKRDWFLKVFQDKKLSSLNWVIYNFNFCSDRTLEPYCNSKSVSQTSLLCSPMNI